MVVLDVARAVEPTARDTATHIPELDALRGLAVAVVVAFHAHWLTGGWLGVDLFFVLSGFLITRLLFAERAKTGTISLGRFWARRARRLLPAVMVLLVVVAFTGQLNDLGIGASPLRTDLIGALTYTSNWVRLGTNAGYWSQFAAPALLDHLWSLAIEEQFYLLWPILVLAALRRGRRTAIRVIVGLAAVAAVWHLVAHQFFDTSRMYMGTDTRAVSLLAGAVVAVLEPNFRRLSGYAAWLLQTVGLVVFGIGVVVLNGTWAITYRGGLFLATCASMAIIASIAAGISQPFLRNGVLRWFGQRSYGLYLWHWPILVWLGVRDPDGAPHLRRVVAVMLSLAAAEISYRLVEMPVRTGRWRGRRFAVPLLLMGTALATTSLVVVDQRASRRNFDAGYNVALPDGSAPLTPGQAPPVEVTASTVAVTITNPPTSTASGSSDPVVLAADDSGLGDALTTIRNSIPRPEGRPPRILLVGDSVAVALGRTLDIEAERLGFEVVVRAMSACPILPTGPKDPNSPRCLERRAEYSSWANEPVDAVLLVFGGPSVWTYDFENGETGDTCSAGYRPWAEGQIRKVVDDLTGGGKVRSFLVTKPYWGIDLGIPAEEVNRFTDCENAAIREIGARSSGALTIIDLHTLICPAGWPCVEEFLGITLRPDGAHYEGPSAVLVGRWLVDQMFAA